MLVTVKWGGILGWGQCFLVVMLLFVEVLPAMMTTEYFYFSRALFMI